jgi:hypothetical protein
VDVVYEADVLEALDNFVEAGRLTPRKAKALKDKLHEAGAWFIAELDTTNLFGKHYLNPWHNYPADEDNILPLEGLLDPGKDRVPPELATALEAALKPHAHTLCDKSSKVRAKFSVNLETLLAAPMLSQANRDCIRQSAADINQMEQWLGNPPRSFTDLDANEVEGLFGWDGDMTTDDLVDEVIDWLTPWADLSICQEALETEGLWTKELKAILDDAAYPVKDNGSKQVAAMDFQYELDKAGVPADRIVKVIGKLREQAYLSDQRA